MQTPITHIPDKTHTVITEFIPQKLRQIYKSEVSHPLMRNLQITRTSSRNLRKHYPSPSAAHPLHTKWRARPSQTTLIATSVQVSQILPTCLPRRTCKAVHLRHVAPPHRPPLNAKPYPSCSAHQVPSCITSVLAHASRHQLL